jgi:hypothetical protein
MCPRGFTTGQYSVAGGQSPVWIESNYYSLSCPINAVSRVFRTLVNLNLAKGDATPLG